MKSQKTMSKVASLLLVSGLILSAGAYAQPRKPVTAVKDLKGYQCMALAANYGPDGINAAPAPVYSGSESNAPQIGLSGGVIIVPDPIQPINGRTITIRSNGQKAWIDVNLLTNWHALSDPSATCIPTILSNGRYGSRNPR